MALVRGAWTKLLSPGLCQEFMELYRPGLAMQYNNTHVKCTCSSCQMGYYHDNPQHQARALLLSILDEQQLKDYMSRKQFKVTGKSGQVYEIVVNDMAYNVFKDSINSNHGC